ncbi:DUF4417 domain-containing protein [Fibrobacter succinogenes]|jgi:hypothetical protein|uniref:DUF4417 domain-containing protein n=1 Tax=Fibrobacter succinogenes TaxID=833 RepID=UPI00156738EC|nr:DUF4417 domain-containing protein [Fibrobacter succinogenes]MBQ1652147.1 DUF4417 domain-containing protein [Bacteroidales bacterium]MBQ1695398.1 DUF4417 domain-containing protein [Bacteroidales bacterium]
MKSYEFRNQEKFLRNGYKGEGRWALPKIKKQPVNLNNLQFLSFNNTRYNEQPMFRDFAVHFFVDDKRFEVVYSQPERNLEKLKQYKVLLTPDFSLYAEMQPWRRIESTGKSRWCGAYWQSKGLTVIPTISWSTPESFDYAFDGIEKNSFVAIGTLGCKHAKRGFLKGFDAMCERLSPQCIICFGTPFSEMEKEPIFTVDYVNSWRF